MFTSPFKEKDLQQAKQFIADKLVKNIFFSEGTYQVEVVEPKETFWPFLQLTDRGEIRDYFCTCEQAEKKGSCPHLAAAFLSIYNEHLQPLHVRFRDSLWNILFQIAANRHGYEVGVLKKQKDSNLYYAQSLTRKKLFAIEAFTKRGEKRLSEILKHRPIETEETSLKFSNLSEEELSLWREGRPTSNLQYELSFWSDLAKWMMGLVEENKEYVLTFSPSKNAIPKEIHIAFKEVGFSIYIAENNWEEILPILAMMEVPIGIYEYQDLVFESMIYDPDKKELIITSQTKDQLASGFFQRDEDERTIVLGEWVFHPEVGFYRKTIDPMLTWPLIREEHMSEMLSHHARLLEKHLKNTTIRLEVSNLSYHLYFDKEQKLHIAAYIFEPMDLQKERSTYFGGWAYVDGKGFCQLGKLMFNEIHKVIEKEDVSAFVTHHKVWLNQYEGFQTHLTSIESHLTYGIDKNDRLLFRSVTESMEESFGIIDMQDWIYIEGKGFYAKAAVKLQQMITPGLVLEKEDISSFIKSNEEELELVRGFFSRKQPIEKSGLDIFLGLEGKIEIHPTIQFASGYSESDVKFFGDYTYVAKEGFSLLPKGGRLPERYRHHQVISPGQEETFFTKQLPMLKPYILSIDPRLKPAKNLQLKLHSIKAEEAHMKREWLMELTYESEYGEVSVKDLWGAIRQGQKRLKSEAGLLSLEDARFSWLRELNGAQFLKDHTLKMSTLEWIRLSILEHVSPPSFEEKNAEESLLFLEEMRQFHTSDVLNLDGLTSQLRSYQEKGVQWLWFLYCYGLSGLLCDEMGLGKTHQAMGLLAACLNLHGKKRKKFLVVCPTSVIYHWEELLKKFLPGSNVLVFYGVQRTLKGFEEEGDILLTSYGTLRSERDPLSEIQFEIAIFDELHLAKNVYSQTHQALKKIQTKMKLGLTGTPIENRLIELHALFDIILPDYLPKESRYRELFVVPIEKNQDRKQKELLSQLIHPFTLRRKKEEVLQELPEKIEKIAYVEMSDEQKKLYKEAYLQTKTKLLKDMEEEVPYMHVFALFNHLKQICNHPALWHKDVENYEKYKSGKWELFVELLEEARESGRKLVIFSQYLKMLDIIELYLKNQNIGYAQIRGSTKNRREEMLRFRQDPNCEVFIGSLQAAGVGIDLVSASVVIHYDRWWNPAKENQATDRVYRIGQNRGVQVFKIVCKDSLEEYIHEMIEKKLLLLQEIVSYDDQHQIKHLSREEITDILNKIDHHF